ncbi:MULTISPECIES: hypothetical protein [unclassified Cupriavidus]|uniref:hypothetical protein n=1 Tax=unclassified Cupriavidus TaxID=2640874 RepID=UPI0010F6EB3B|nr:MULTISPECIES: hypothetical protein [unclassified Cupriavidus]MWL92087.1 hypothetical protein [Cupriavidus sp. SW-Y-13]
MTTKSNALTPPADVVARMIAVLERRAPQRAEVDDQVTLEVLESGTGHLEALIREARPRIRPSRIALALALRNGRRWQSKVGAQQVRMKRNKKIAQYMVELRRKTIRKEAA